MRLTFKKICPYCESTYFVRIPRKSYMRMSSSLKYYECDLCRHDFLVYGTNSNKMRHHRPEAMPVREDVQGIST